MKKTRIVIVGGSFGGLTAAHRLRRLLPRKSREIVVISKDDHFVFTPSLPWLSMGQRTLDQISFPLKPSLERKGISFMHGAVDQVDAEASAVEVNGERIDYDILIVATGHRSANEAVPGLGPFDGPGHSLMSAPEAEEARDAWTRFLEDPGPMVIGCAPGASCIGPAYEFAFEVDHALRKRRLRHKVPITFVTPEPFLGHFGVGGVGRGRQFLEGALDERDIRYHTSAAVSQISDDAVLLADDQRFESRYSMIIPPLAGVEAIKSSAGLGNPKGFIPTDDGFRHKQFDNIYAVGVTVAYPPVDDTPVPVNFPKTGHMTEQMARAAATNIAADLRGGDRVERPPFVECIMDMGGTAARMMADPVRPPRNEVRLSAGKRWLWAKRLFEPYFLWKMRTGRA